MALRVIAIEQQPAKAAELSWRPSAMLIVSELDVVKQTTAHLARFRSTLALLEVIRVNALDGTALHARTK